MVSPRSGLVPPVHPGLSGYEGRHVQGLGHNLRVGVLGLHRLNLLDCRLPHLVLARHQDQSQLTEVISQETFTEDSIHHIC